MDIYQKLRQDHQEILELIQELVSLKAEDDYRFEIIDEISSTLLDHLKAEESVFYTTLQRFDPASTLVTQAYKDHLEIESLLQKMQINTESESQRHGDARKLKDLFKQHVLKEESLIFSFAQKFLSESESNELGEVFDKIKISSLNEEIDPHLFREPRRGIMPRW
jgi:hemerythrin superfamily protein